MNNRQKIVILLMDIFIFIELTYSILQGKKDLENMTAVFFMNFIPLFLITYIISRILVRRLESTIVSVPAQSESQGSYRLESNYDINHS